MLQELPDVALLKSRAEATLARIRSAVESGQVPIVAQIIRIIQEISNKADQMSVSDLAETISQDPTTMSRIIAIAGTLAYNPGGVEITSITQAIAVVGFERIRNLAIAVLLMENAYGGGTSETVRELAGLSFCSGLVAAEICRRTQSMDPDLVFVCGALRSYGRLLMATVMAEEYGQVLELAGHAGAADESFRLVFGLTPLDLGRELLTSMQLPPLILKSLRSTTERASESMDFTSMSATIAVADLGLRIAETIGSADLNADNFAERIELASRNYGKEFLFTKDKAEKLIQDISGQMQSFCARGGFDKKSVVLFQRVENLALGLPLPQPFQPKPIDARKQTISKGALPGARQTKNATPSPSGIIEEAGIELGRLAQEEPPDDRLVLTKFIQTLHDALRLRNCLLFVKERQGKRFFLHNGIGPLFQDLHNSAVLSPDLHDVFSVPLRTGDVLLIENPDEPGIQPFLPAWLRRSSGGPQPFCLLPVKDALGTFALACCTVETKAGFTLMHGMLNELQRLRAQISPLGRHLR